MVHTGKRDLPSIRLVVQSEVMELLGIVWQADLKITYESLFLFWVLS